MMRTTLLCLLAAACVGTVESGDGTEGGLTGDLGPDAGTGGGGAVNPTPDASSPVACDPPVTTADKGEHKPGEPCLQCHTGGNAPKFTVGGTLYNGIASSVPVVGATIHLVDANGADIPLVTALNGNFWTDKPIMFPVTVRASRCPDTKPMVSPVTQTGGDCNMAGCHTTNFRAYLP
jgi:hypothetical protein